MKKPLLLEANQIEQAYLAENILHSLQSIQNQLEKEIRSKQKTIERQETEIQQLRQELDERNTSVLELNSKLRECQKQTDGNRQLVNKLLGDIDRLQQDVDWYKRTYESRSFLGTLKEKMKTRRIKK